MDNSTLLSRARGVVEREAAATRKVADQLNEKLADVVDLLFHCKGKILVTGAGTSRFVAERFAHLLCCCGAPALFINAADSLHGGAGAIADADVAFIISKGGHSLEINRFAEIARNRGAKIVSLTENLESPLALISDVIYLIKAEGDVDPYGMIATGSSLVNSVACDVLCIALLEMRGYTKDKFGETHPGGAVGRKLQEETK